MHRSAVIYRVNWGPNAKHINMALSVYVDNLS
jgi:hypothetical protein